MLNLVDLLKASMFLFKFLPLKLYYFACICNFNTIVHIILFKSNLTTLLLVHREMGQILSLY